MKNSTIRVICFLLVFVLIFGEWKHIFKFKYNDGIYCFTNYYKLEKDTVDVLTLGSSHSFVNINPGTMWDEYGVACYNLGGPVQPLWNTFYMLKDALKTQTPKLIVLEAFSTVLNYDYDGGVGVIKNTYGLKESINKYQSILNSIPKDEQRDYLLEYTQYHNRYKELSREDFLKNKGELQYKNWKGYYCKPNTSPFYYTDVTDITERTPLTEKTEKYYCKILELAQANNIPIMVIVAPYPGISNEEQMVFNSAKDIAEAYGAKFINYNFFVDDIGLDYLTDVADGHHLNHLGAQKFSSYLGKDIVSIYGIQDRRGNVRYLSWQKDAEYTRRMISNQIIRDCDTLENIIDNVNRNGYDIIISLDGTFDYDNVTVYDSLAQLGLNNLIGNGIFYIKDGSLVWESSGNEDYYISYAYHDFHLKCNPINDREYTNAIIMDGTSYSKVSNGINIVIYDSINNELVDALGLNADDNYNLTR